MNKRKAGSDNDSGDAQADLLAEQKKEAKKTAKEKNARQKAKAAKDAKDAKGAKDAKDAKDEKTRPPAVPDPIPAGGPGRQREYSGESPTKSETCTRKTPRSPSPT